MGKNLKGTVAGKVQTRGRVFTVKLDFISFDDGKCRVIYCPALDLSGYGNDEESARQSFQISLEAFLDYSVSNKTLERCLTKLGWTFNKSNNMVPPKMDNILTHNRSFKHIFNSFPFEKTSSEVFIPVC